MNNREILNLNPKKLKEEDRRFLLSKNSTELLFNEQMIMNNRVMIISIFAVLISIATMMITSNYNTNNQKLGVIIFLSLIALYLIYSFIISFIKIKGQQKQIQSQYDELFKHHLAYATKRIE